MQLLLDSSISNNIIQHFRLKNGVEVSRGIPWLKLGGNTGVLHARSSAGIHQSFWIVAALAICEIIFKAWKIFRNINTFPFEMQFKYCLTDCSVE